MSVDEKLAAAEQKALKAQLYRDKLIIIKTAEAEIPGLWDTGQLSMTKLSEQYGISSVTVRRILVDAGRNIHAYRKLNDDERAEVIAHLKNQESPDGIAAAYHVSRATIRRIGIEGGVLNAGVRKPRRTDADYALVQAFDAEARQRFNGAGLYNLGMGLRAWQQKQKGMARVLAEASSPPLPVDGDHPNDPVEPEVQAANEAKVEAQPTPPENPTPVVFGDGVEDAAAVVGPYANQAEQKPGGFSF